LVNPTFNPRIDKFQDKGKHHGRQDGAAEKLRQRELMPVKSGTTNAVAKPSRTAHATGRVMKYRNE